MTECPLEGSHVVFKPAPPQKPNGYLYAACEGGHTAPASDDHYRMRARPLEHDCIIEKLTTAVRAENHTLVLKLLTQGASPDEQDGRGVTPLTVAVMRSDVECVRMLVARGADVNVTDASQQTALMRAVRENHLEIARLLIQRGASRDSNRALLRAAELTRSMPIVELVLDAGLDYATPEPPCVSVRCLVADAVRKRWTAVLMGRHKRLGGGTRCLLQHLPCELLQALCYQWLCPAWLRM